MIPFIRVKSKDFYNLTPNIVKKELQRFKISQIKT